MTNSTPGPWDIEEGIADPERFFALLPSLLPSATLFFAEGNAITRDVEDCYLRFADPGPYIPKRQTLWPRSRLFRCSAEPAFFQALSHLGARHAAPELLDHLSIYEGERALLEWHDAFANAILLDATLPEATVACLAESFGCAYGRARFPNS